MITFDAEMLGPWVAQRADLVYVPNTASGIGRIKNGQIVAGVLYQDHNGPNVFCHIAAEGNRWANRRFLSIIFDYPFKQLKVKRITVCVAESNTASRRFVEHLGFELEANLQGAHPNGDLLVYKMTVENCRWLKELPYESTFSRNP